MLFMNMIVEEMAYMIILVFVFLKKNVDFLFPFLSLRSVIFVPIDMV